MASEQKPELVLGIDGGGTTTIALLARKDDGQILGRGLAGPSNIQSVGVPAGLKALDDAITQAFQSAGLQVVQVASACLGLAGVDRQEGLDVIHGWAERVNLADRIQIANDATLLLAAGTPNGWGLAVIAGTGSIAFVRKPSGEVGRCGGWGHLLGDEGSAYRIALNGLRAACRSFDGIGPKTAMIDAFVLAMDLKEAPDFIPAVYRGAWDRTAIAGLAPVVLKLAEKGDTLASEIVSSEASELALTAAQAVKANDLESQPIPVALAGGVLSKSEAYREQFLKVLAGQGIVIASVEVVIEPALGAVVLARN